MGPLDPMVSLAFSMYSNKGVYALLLGSGVSQSASIKTGREITADLARRLARAYGEDCGDCPEDWYKVRFNEELTYSSILDQLANTQQERAGLLHLFFEPTEADREQENKLPQRAHRAIADLIKEGHIKVIVTTNFDRLIETALIDHGITPQVITTPDAIEGALPLVHSECTIIKVNGDYKDSRIKNTVEELQEYSEPMKRLLNQVVSEFGLIVCGWSAEWDKGLAQIIESCPNRRFSLYWASIRDFEHGSHAQRIINSRKGTFIRIYNADSFFVDLRDRLVAMDDISRSDPLSTRIAVPLLKKYISEDRHGITVHDFVMKETERAYNILNCERCYKASDDASNYIRHCENATEIVRSLLVTGCLWGTDEQKYLWAKAFERIGRPRTPRRFNNCAFDLYPALILFYAAGVAAVASRRYSNLDELLFGTRINGANNIREFKPPYEVLDPHEVICDNQIPNLFPNESKAYQVSNHIYKLLRDNLTEYIPDTDNYDRYFNQFEYIITLMRLIKCHEQKMYSGRFLSLGIKDYNSFETLKKEMPDEVFSKFFNSEYEFHDAEKKIILALRESNPHYYSESPI